MVKNRLIVFLCVYLPMKCLLSYNLQVLFSENCICNKFIKIRQNNTQYTIFSRVPHEIKTQIQEILLIGRVGHLMRNIF